MTKVSLPEQWLTLETQMLYVNDISIKLGGGKSINLSQYINRIKKKRHTIILQLIKFIYLH